MKKYFLLALVVWTGIASSCKYDDDEVWDSVNDLTNRVTALEAAVKQMNSDIAALQSIVAALQKQVAISEVETLADGYILHFTDGTKATIKNGEDGKDGENGKDGQNAPIIGVALEYGVYYWTVTMDGKTEWLTDDDGHKLPVSGKDGEDGSDGATGPAGKDGNTPLLKVDEEGYWTVSYDNGTTYKRLTDVNDNEVKVRLFKEIEKQEDCVVITLADGVTKYEFPLLGAVRIIDDSGVTVDEVYLEFSAGVSPLYYDVPSLGTNYSVEVLKAPKGVMVIVDETDKTLTIRMSESEAESGKIVILFYNAHQTITYSLDVTIG